MKILLPFFVPLFLFSLFKKDKRLLPNHPPHVKIVMPVNNSSFTWNTAVRYKIDVSDQEDGDSRYGEIAPKEVIVEVRYEENLSAEQADSIKRNIRVSPGLAAMESSNCFNCHRFNTKSTGPSFRQIGMHYAHSRANLELLAIHIKNGSSGIWGNQAMPSHSNLTDKEAEDIVKWIFTHVMDTSLNFYTGIRGSFMIKRQDNDRKGACILTANYTDHGTKGAARMTDRDRVIIYGK